MPRARTRASLQRGRELQKMLLEDLGLRTLEHYIAVCGFEAIPIERFLESAVANELTVEGRC